MTISDNAKVVLQKRYLSRDKEGKVTETVEDLFKRVAVAIAAADSKYGQDVKTAETDFYNVMTSLDFLPNSPTLMNAGKPLGQLSACFVLPIEDSMEAIFETIKNAALIHKSGGGTGFSFSRLRQAGATVSSTGGVASGPISFMKVFNVATEAVKQGGTRRGANMGILRVDHPDILAFIDCKKDNGDINNFNISVGITEAFMNAVEKGKDYDLIDPKTKLSVGKLSAKMVYDKIVNAAWSNGEPGIIFLDRLNKFNITPTKGEIESTNPCGEQPLLPYESCNLGSINLVNMLTLKGDKYQIDFDRLGKTVDIAVHFLDNVIDVNKYPLPQIDETTRASRKIGLGVMGFADMLLMLNVAYNSDEGLDTARRVMKFVNERGHAASQNLAKVRGAFPIFNESLLKDGIPQRNATVTTIAPTGTLSIIANCSSGVEPIFGYVYIRNVMDKTQMVEVNDILKDKLTASGQYSQALMKQIAAEGTLAHTNLAEEIKRVFVSAHDISPESHIKMQAVFQEYVDNAVSKTVNFPREATVEQVDSVYRLAYKLGLKGVTSYRDGSRDNQVLNIGSVNDGKTKQQAVEQEGLVPRNRPDVVNGFTEKVQIGCGNLYITVNYDDKGIVEVFTNTGKGGGCPSQSEATARLLSIALRSGVDGKKLIEQLRGIRCPSTIRQPGLKVTSCPDAIAKVVQKAMLLNSSANGQSAEKAEAAKPAKQTQQIERKAVEGTSEAHYCAECGAKLEHEGGCVICRNCGFSKCG